MSAKTNAEVVIDGKVYTLSGYENEEYLQKVAAYINNKIAEFDDMDEYKHLPGNMSWMASSGSRWITAICSSS